MRKEIQKDGSTSQKIRITAEDLKLYGLKIGDIVEITITKIDHPNKLKGSE